MLATWSSTKGAGGLSENRFGAGASKVTFKHDEESDAYNEFATPLSLRIRCLVGEGSVAYNALSSSSGIARIAVIENRA